MVKILNSYQSEPRPIAKVFSEFGSSLFGDTLTPEVRRQQAFKLSAENAARERFGSAATDAFTNPGNANMVAQVVRDAMLGGMDPRHVAQAGQYVAGNAYGAADPRTTNATIGAGGAYSSTVPGFREAQSVELQKNAAGIASRERMFGATPVEVMTPEGPRFSTRAQAPGQMPLAPEANVKGGYLANNFGNLGALPPAEQQVLGAASKETGVPEMVRLQRERNLLWAQAGKLPLGDPMKAELQRQGDELDGFIRRKIAGSEGFSITQPDGTVIQMGGGGRDPVTMRNLTASVRNLEETRGLITTAVGLVDRAPSIVGPVGNIRRMGQDVSSIATEVAKSFGGQEQYQAAVERARADLAAKGLDTLLPGLFNPDLNSIETLNTLLLYKAAEALGQTGHGVSNKDIERIAAMVGDPTSWFTSAATYKNKLMALDNLLANRQRMHASEAGRQANNPSAITMPSAPEVQIPAEKDGSRMPGGAPARGQVDGGVPASAVQFLRANPQHAAEFDAKYGAGAAAHILGGQ